MRGASPAAERGLLMSPASNLRFSFILPALNEEAYIGACIRSIQVQPERAHEIIVVDNGCRAP
jgi:cellulose synthase/poly-beta-1,6-N-acetylglucosamine synthase-like glycosyltransferase